jgi:hypothetical protein
MLRFEIVEVNPVIDEHNRTGDLAVELDWTDRKHGQISTRGAAQYRLARFPASRR